MVVDTLVNVFSEMGHETTSAVNSSEENRLRGAKILLVEDNEINQQIALELLEGVGARVQVAGNGREAVELLFNKSQPQSFDVVLMDVQMPEMDGYQATTKLRSDARFSTLPIIAMTAHATLEERQRCLDAGMNDHISKPIDPRMLFDTVSRFYRPKLEGSTVVGATRDQKDPTSPSDPAHTHAPLPLISGLDQEDGLVRVAGNAKLYVEILGQFEQQQAQAPAQIAQALAVQDQALAERLAHTLKGVAGNIGAKSVQTAAGILEKLIRNRVKSEEVESARTQLDIVLSPLIAELRNALKAVAPETAPQFDAAHIATEPAQFHEAAQHLASLLSEFDPGAADFIETNQSRLRPLFTNEEWEQLKQNARAYAFQECQVLVVKAMQKIPDELTDVANISSVA
jgi:CheY-like chemotaxis protein